ncbi:MAG TPA: hypothetical protein VF531_01590 [Bacillota bacterium]
MLYAIHVHPHDIRDEGAERVVENITELGKIKTIIAEAMTLEERHPYPDGVLPHNPRHSVVVSWATLEVPLSGRLFSGLSIQPVPSAEVLAGNDYIGLLRKAAAVGGATVIPWVKGLNGAFSGRIEDLSVKTLDGQPVPTWLCPSRPETFEYIASLIEGILDRYPSEAILLDRMRYPDWSGANVQPERMLTCFCDSCCRMMEDEGIDLALLKSVLKRFLKQPDQPGGRFQNLSGAELNEIRKWLGFRAALITRLVDRVSTQVKIYNQTRHMNTKFWLNLWPPSFAWFLGQDYQALGRLCDGAKHFPYHRLGGGADLKGLVEALAIHEDREAQEKIFLMVMELLQIPYAMSFEKFKEFGFPVDFVGRETGIAKQAFGHCKQIFSGIQIWNTPMEEIDKACDSARRGDADGFFFYCYGWAELKALQTIGRIIG